mmetsp:Transcript_80271/g.233090  ORF Transcript_80271/g.233090 Transcript_80271/m.233090 type:complete len:406 (-) Transcript_80271:347-1564(-)
MHATAKLRIAQESRTLRRPRSAHGSHGSGPASDRTTTKKLTVASARGHPKPCLTVMAPSGPKWTSSWATCPYGIACGIARSSALLMGIQRYAPVRANRNGVHRSPAATRTPTFAVCGPRAKQSEHRRVGPTREHRQRILLVFGFLKVDESILDAETDRGSRHAAGRLGLAMRKGRPIILVVGIGVGSSPLTAADVARRLESEVLNAELDKRGVASHTLRWHKGADRLASSKRCEVRLWAVNIAWRWREVVVVVVVHDGCAPPPQRRLRPARLLQRKADTQVPRIAGVVPGLRLNCRGHRRHQRRPRLRRDLERRRWRPLRLRRNCGRQRRLRQGVRQQRLRRSLMARRSASGGRRLGCVAPQLGGVMREGAVRARACAAEEARAQLCAPQVGGHHQLALAVREAA